MINVTINQSGVPDKKAIVLGNKYENKDEEIQFELPSQYDNYNKYLIAVQNLPFDEKITRVLPITNNTIIVSSALTSHSGKWYMYVMCREKEIDIDAENIDISAKQNEHVFISNGIIGIVQDSLICGQEINNIQLDENLKIVYDDLMDLKNQLEEVVFGSLTWDEILNKPTEFTPAPHNHNDSYYTKNEVVDIVNENIEDIAVTKDDVITNEEIESLFRQRGWSLN